MKIKWFRKPALIAAALMLGMASTTWAQDAEMAEVTADVAYDAAAAVNETAYAIDNMFLMLAAVLVLFMQAGFAMVESGFNQAKNTVNILFKNLMDLCIGMILFFIIGYGLMYPGDGNGVLAFGQFGIGGMGADAAEAGALVP